MTNKYPDPKRLDYSRPMLFEGFSGRGRDLHQRYRVLYPCHAPEWVTAFGLSLSDSARDLYIWSRGPCWWKPGMTPRQQVAAMKAYDKREGRTTIFLGYLA